MLTLVLSALAFAAILAFILGFALGWFQDIFKVERDPVVEKARAAMPGANCGGCGFPGCDGFAEALAAGRAGPGRCSAGGSATAARLAEILGVESKFEDRVAVLRCSSTAEKTLLKGEYVGVKSCIAAKLTSGGVKACAWACQGFGDCVEACKFGALSLGEDGLPKVDYAKCVGCGQCEAQCPQKLFTIVPRAAAGSVVLCSNRSAIKGSVRKVCKAGCIKCGACVRTCPEKCVELKDAMPVVDYSRCRSCGKCVEACPTGNRELMQTIIKSAAAAAPIAAESGAAESGAASEGGGAGAEDAERREA
jgi:Na+-translocating ferredoxin:NAD+ oxidoreductase subunit B